MVHAITDTEEFQEKLTEAGDKAVIADFYATWCGPCKMVAPHFLKLAETHPTIMALKVDVDEVEDIAQDYQIQAMPTFVVFKGGVEVERMMGANKDKMEELFTKYK